MDISDAALSLGGAGHQRESAQRGFIGSIPNSRIVDGRGRVVWTVEDYAFLDAQKPAPTVHPNLWRHAQLNHLHGLFKVTERVYQVRGLTSPTSAFSRATPGSSSSTR